MDREQARLLALQLLDDTAQAGAVDAEEDVERLLEPGYWLDLNPGLTVGEDLPSSDMESEPLAGATVETIARSVAERGYLQTPPVLSGQKLAAMAAAVEAVREAGWPPTVCFVYDQFWQVARTPSIRALVAGTLGDGFAQIPKVWCHYVNPTKRSSGWRPHCDNAVEKAPRDQRLTLWIPLTEATLDNGCMYLIPRDMVAGEDLEKTDARTLLSATRALPAQPGEILGWDHYTLHWGSSVSGQATAPRVSLSLEFLRANCAPHADELPLVDMDRLPSFERRLAFIASGVTEYVKFEPMLAKHAGLFRRIGERVAA